MAEVRLVVGWQRAPAREIEVPQVAGRGCGEIRPGGQVLAVQPHGLGSAVDAGAVRVGVRAGRQARCGAADVDRPVWDSAEEQVVRDADAAAHAAAGTRVTCGVAKVSLFEYSTLGLVVV